MVFITYRMENGMGIDIKLGKKTYQPNVKNQKDQKSKEERKRDMIDDFKELEPYLDLDKMSKHSKMRFSSWMSSTNMLGFRIVVIIKQYTNRNKSSTQNNNM